MGRELPLILKLLLLRRVRFEYHFDGVAAWAGGYL